MQEILKPTFDNYKNQLELIFEDIHDFDFFRRNFLERTKYTQLTVLNVFKRVINTPHASDVLRNLEEEMGLGYPCSHLELLYRAFGYPDGKEVTAETRTFIRRKRTLFAMENLDYILGDFIAHEMAASHMLKLILDKFGDEIMDRKYFDVHLDGTEERHSEDSLKMLELVIKENSFLAGFESFLLHQLDLFRSLRWKCILMRDSKVYTYARLKG